MLRTIKFAPLLLLAVLFGCGEGDGNPATAPVISSFTATPTNIAAGATASLNWTVTGSPTSLTIDNGVGVVSGNNRNVNPTVTTTYTLTATNSIGSDTETVTVTVGGTPPPPPPVCARLFSASPPRKPDLSRATKAPISPARPTRASSTSPRAAPFTLESRTAAPRRSPAS